MKELRSHYLISSLSLHTCVFLVFMLFAKNMNQMPQVQAPLYVEIQTEPLNRQVVDVNTGKEVKTAKKDSFLSDKNRVVEKEQVAKKTGEQKQNRVAKPMPKLANLGVDFSKNAMRKLEKARDQSAPKKSKPYEFNEARYQEYVKGMKEGESTALNTKEFVFYSYFARIRKSLDIAWRRKLRKSITKLYRRGRSLASSSEYLTKTLITLDDQGQILRIQVLEESGKRDLDQAAVKAFNDAGPFPNPPQGLLDTARKIEIRWDFLLRT